MVIVFWCSIGMEKDILPVFVAAHDLLIEAGITRALAVVLEGVQHIGGMKIVNPVQVAAFAVKP